MTEAINYSTGEIVDPLTSGEEFSLEQYEEIIDAGLKTFVEVGDSLAAIRNARLYRATHGTFETYCESRWNLSRKRAYDLIGAAETVQAMSPMGDTPLPTSERQARELSGLAPERAAETMREAHAATAGKVTAKAIRDARDTHEASQAKKDVEQFPSLSHYAEQGRTSDVVRLAGALREYDAPEQKRRLDILDKTIAFERGRSAAPERHLSVAPTTPVAPDHSSLIAELVRDASRIASSRLPAVELATDLSDDDLRPIEAAADYLNDLIAAIKESR